VRIAPEYTPPVVHVIDASRVVGVVADLLEPERREKLDRENRQEQERLRALHAERLAQPLLPYRIALERRTPIVWHEEDLATPPFLGARTVEPDLATLREYIDWTFYFTAWELKGRFPQILDHPQHGQAARELFDHANGLLDRILREGSLTARAVYGYWTASADDDDLVLHDGPRFPMLRQQADHGDDRPNRSLADFVAPARDGLVDHVGAFACTAGIGADRLAAAFEAEHDDYSAIAVKALADRLAEACAEWLHERVRREWYEFGPQMTNEELIEERYRGIRPAFGYPACPDHSRKRSLFELLDAGSIGMELTETCAMTPAASVSGMYFAHPAARYFNVGRIGRDQVEEYAERCGMDRREAESWLRPNLAYDPV
jgi:5-methyltetrahydrofolate--homocysteine methyltransferase